MQSPETATTYCNANQAGKRLFTPTMQLSEQSTTTLQHQYQSATHCCKGLMPTRRNVREGRVQTDDQIENTNTNMLHECSCPKDAHKNINRRSASLGDDQ